MAPPDVSLEWLETDGRGGFAIGTAGLVRTRRYHSLLAKATTPPTGRMVLVNGLEVWADVEGASHALSSQRYVPDVQWPDGVDRLVDFAPEPWPSWTFELPGGLRIRQEILVSAETGETLIWWRIERASESVRLRARPLVSGRNYHALHHENPAFDFEAATAGEAVVLRPYPGVPPISIATNGAWSAQPLWFRQFFYALEAERGLDCVEDLASPGEFAFDLSPDSPAAMILSTSPAQVDDAQARAEAATAKERLRRSGAPSRLARSAQNFLVRRGDGCTVFAGYPWFTDWGRDAFVSLRGLALGTGNHTLARSVLATWVPFVSEGMTPNFFPDGAAAPEYNSVGASLWYVVAAHDLFASARPQGESGAEKEKDRLIRAACEAILDGYRNGARFGIAADSDGLLKCGAPGVALTWMDARVDGVPVTPRHGKPVEVQALWINALSAAALWAPRFAPLAARAARAFALRFPNPNGGLFDVIDVEGAPDRVDASVRPNQIFAVGGLPFPCLGGEGARGVVDCVERELLTPLGLRTLSPRDPAYAGRYQGGPAQRDAAYHQGAAWPWLMGAFVDAWLNVRGRTPSARQEARTRFAAPLLAHLDRAGLGHVSELADGDPPHCPRGCPFQAWSLGELIRIVNMLGAIPAQQEPTPQQ